MNYYITVRFITADGFVSKAIRWITGSLFSHVEFGTPDGTWIGAHIDGGVQERIWNYCTPTREYVYQVPCTLEEQLAHLKRIRSKIGTKYNTSDIIGLLIKNKKLHTVNSVICSQFVSDEALTLWGATRYLNVLADFTYWITPEISHLSPVFAGRLVKKVG